MPQKTQQFPQLRLFKRLSEIQITRVEWLWYPYIPLGKLTVLQGNPSLNKTTLGVDIGARTTTGGIENPEAIGHPRGGVLYLSSEDGAADTLRPRFEVAGGDLRRARVLCPDAFTSQIQLPHGLDLIEAECRRIDAKLVVFDTLPAFMSGSMSNIQSVNRALLPLRDLAEKLGIAVILVRHLRKNAGKDLLALGAGSIAVSGIARSVLHLEKHPEQKNVRILIQAKPNLVPDPPIAQFTVEDSGHGQPLIRYDGFADYSEEIAACYRHPNLTAKKLLKAEEMLRRRLRGKRPALATELQMFAEALGISQPTLNRAKSRLGVYSNREMGHWYWVWPEWDIEDDQDDQPATGERDSGELTQPSIITDDSTGNQNVPQDDHLPDDHLGQAGVGTGCATAIQAPSTTNDAQATGTQSGYEQLDLPLPAVRATGTQLNSASSTCGQAPQCRPQRQRAEFEAAEAEARAAKRGIWSLEVDEPAP